MKKILLAAIILIGLLLRLYGAGHGLVRGRVFHPDTPKQIMFLRHYIDGDYRIRYRIENRDYYGYPSLHIHIAEWIYRGVRGLAAFSDYPEWSLKPHQLWFFVRVLTALFSAASVVFVYLAGKTLFTERAGILAAGIFAVNPFSVGMAHFIMGDTAMTFFALAAFYVFALCLKKQSSLLYLLGGLLLGLAAACKYNGAFMAVPGIFALLYRPNRRTASRFLALAFGAVLGFTTGNPSMFTHFSEGFRGALAFLGFVSGLGWDTSQHRLVAALMASPVHLKNLYNVSGLLLVIASLASFIWMFYKKQGMKAYFAVVFPLSYFFLTIISQPYPRALYLLVMAPFLSIMAGWFLTEAGKGKKAYSAAFSFLAAVILIQGLYASFAESFLFKEGDTRISAEEWIANNIPPYFEIGASRYSVENPHAGAEMLRGAGSFFASSGLVGMPYPGGGEEVKPFSYEDRTPPLLHRNPDIKIMAYYGEELRSGFKVPLFNRLPMLTRPAAPVSLGGVDFGINPLNFQVPPVGNLLLVSGEPVEEILVSVTNFNRPAKVAVRVANRTRRIKLAPYETALLRFEKPLRQPPFNRYYYRLSARAGLDEKVFIRAAVSPAERGMIHFDRGEFAEAEECFQKVSGRFHPAEVDIMRAFSHSKSGEVEKALELAGDISFWGEEYVDIAPGGNDMLFRKMHIGNTGISVDYLETVNAVRFEAGSFASMGGKMKRVAFGDEENHFHVIECEDGEAAFIFGPYHAFPRGNYTARFVFNTAEAATGTNIWFDVSAGAGARVIAEKRFEGGGALPAEVLVPFAVRGEAEFLEFRTFLEGKGKVELDYVEVYPDIERNLRDKVEMLRQLRQAD